MSEQMIDEAKRVKQHLRTEAAARRAEQRDADRLSRHIFRQIVALPQYARAKTLMLYIDFGSEVRTRWFFPTAWDEGKRIVVPYCNDGDIELFRLDSLEELAPGTMGILEPKRELRDDADRQIDPSELDVIVAPGLAFDRRGGRVGYGKGYYDRLLHQIRVDATKLAVCFECQMFPEVPQLPHDIRMDTIVTETAVYRANA
jgi:5-formyltetrahydrofolate cyclo-ligase